MKRFVIVKFLIFFIFVGCNEDEIQEPQSITGAFELNENAHVIGETISLLSTDEELEQGIFKFENLQEEISLGDIIVGSHNDGFLRKVNAIESNNNLKIFNTSQAYIDDLFDNSDILIDFNSMLSEELPVSASRSLNFAKSNNSREGLRFDLDNYEITFPSGSAILNGYINFDANYNVHLKTSSLGLDSFNFNTSGSTLDLSLSSNINFTNSIDNTISQSLYSFKRRFVSAYPPVFGSIKFDLVLALTYEASDEYNLQLQGRRKIGIEASINYENGSWQTNLNTPSLVSGGSASFQEQSSNVQVKLRLIPKIDITIYGLVTPQLHPEAFIGYTIEQSEDEQCNEYENWDSNVFLGVGGSVGVSSGLLGFNVIDIERSLPEQRINIWEAPVTLQEISGNNQLLTANTDSEPLVVRVLDDSGNPVQGVNVYYQVEELSCTDIQQECVNTNLSNRQVAVTDENGYASAIFNEALIDYDTLVTATIKNGQGNPLMTSLFFLTSETSNQNITVSIPDTPYTEPVEINKVLFSYVDDFGYCTIDSNAGSYFEFNFCKLKSISSIVVDVNSNCQSPHYWVSIFEADSVLDCRIIYDDISQVTFQEVNSANSVRIRSCEINSITIEFQR